jgi:hypothetical protein
MTSEDLFGWLDSTRETFRKFGVVGVAPEALLVQMEARLRAFINARDEQVLTLAEAARRTGYSAEHLARLIRQGKLPNAGVPNRPRIRAGDLPRRPDRALAASAPAAYDPAADARTLLGRRGGKRA